MTGLRLVVATVLLALGALPRLAVAQDVAPIDVAQGDIPDQAMPSDWRVEVSIYAFVPLRIEGDSTIAGVTTEIDMTLGDVFDNFKILPVAGRIEAWNGDWGIIFDGWYASLDSDGFELTVPVPGGPSIGATLDIDVEQIELNLGVGYRFAEVPVDGDSDRKLILEAMGGLRYGYLRQEIKTNLGPIVGKLGTSYDWVELWFGGRAIYQLNQTTSLAIRADVAGFSIGSGTDLTWRILGGAGFRISQTVTLKVGYEAYEMDYDRGSGTNAFGSNLLMHGPYMAITIDL